MIQITPRIAIREDELCFSFIRSSGPGGQNVNKVSTAVQLRFDAAHSTSIPDYIRPRLLRLAGRRLTESGEILIEARRFRTREQNRYDAVVRLIALIQAAARPSKKRKATKPTLSSQEKRVAKKRRRGEVKRLRGEVHPEE